MLRQPHCRCRRGQQPDVSIVAIVLALSCVYSAVAANWQSTITKDLPGDFPELHALTAHYRFGWSGFTAATGEVHFTKPTARRFQVDATGRTIGLVRALWKLDLTHHATADAETLHPVDMKQTEAYRRKKLITELAFTGGGVTRTRTETPGTAKPKAKEFSFPNLFDLHSAALYLRSQPLRDRDVYRIVVFPATSPYLAALTVVGREKVSVRAGTYNAIKIDLQLHKVGKHLELEPHRKFRRAAIWVSDDSDRVVLRIEAQIFVGTVFAELQSVAFDEAKP